MSIETVTFRTAVQRALGEAMAADERIVLLGEDVGAAGGVFKLVDGRFDRFGPSRVRDTPISEQGFVGAALGAALTGLRPVVEIMFADFAGVCFDQIANQLAKYRYMSGGQFTVPVTVRLSNGAGGGFAAQHSQAVENWFLNVPGLKIVAPSTPDDIHGLLLSAIAEDNPVLVFEHKGLFNTKGPITGEPIPIGRAAVARVGDDVTLVASQLMRHRALSAAEALSSEGIDVEVIDPRTIVPFDDATVLTSLAKTGRLVVVAEGPEDGSWGASLVSRIATRAFDRLETAPRLLCSPSTPVPYARALEEAWIPGEAKIADICREVMGSLAVRARLKASA